MYNKELIKLLIDTAMKSNMNHKYGCAIIFRNKIISTGYNYYKLYNGKIYNNLYQYEQNKFSIHAEKDAIQKIKNKNILKNCKIYIIRIKNDIYNLNFEEGTPCSMCNNLLQKYKLKYVII